MSLSVCAAAARAAVPVAVGLGVACAEPVVLADGANAIVHLSPSPVAAKVAASTTAVRADVAAWLQRELEVDRDPAPGQFRVLAAYGDPIDARQLHTCQQLRLLNLTVW